MSNKLPSAFIRSLIENHHIEKEEFIKSHASGEQFTSIRLNNYKPSDKFTNEAEIPWCKTGRYLDGYPSFTADPLFHAGCYYIQEASSMFLEHVLKHSSDLSSAKRVLDLFAETGARSTLISCLLTADSLLLSNESAKTRGSALAESLIKCGPANTLVSNNESQDFKRLNAFFDIVVVNAPSSGSGMSRKDPDTVNAWSESAVLISQQRQQQILADIYPALKQSGTLIYSTSSHSEQENEEISDWLFDTFNLSPIQIPLQAEWGIEETLSEKHQCYGYRFHPHKVKGEGFFIAAFRKTEASPEAQIKRAKETGVNQNNETIIREWLTEENDLRIMSFHDEFFAIHKNLEADLQFLKSHLSLKKSGVRLGKVMGKGLVPNHELALSLILNKNVRRIEVNRQDAMAYLKRGELKLETKVLGWALICYAGHALGWAKMLGNRMNNYFPKEMRIVNQNIS